MMSSAWAAVGSLSEHGSGVRSGSGSAVAAAVSVAWGVLVGTRGAFGRPGWDVGTWALATAEAVIMVAAGMAPRELTAAWWWPGAMAPFGWWTGALVIPRHASWWPSECGRWMTPMWHNLNCLGSKQSGLLETEHLALKI